MEPKQPNLSIQSDQAEIEIQVTDKMREGLVSMIASNLEPTREVDGITEAAKDIPEIFKEGVVQAMIFANSVKEAEVIGEKHELTQEEWEEAIKLGIVYWATASQGTDHQVVNEIIKHFEVPKVKVKEYLEIAFLEALETQNVEAAIEINGDYEVAKDIDSQTLHEKALACFRERIGSKIDSYPREFPEIQFLSEKELTQPEQTQIILDAICKHLQENRFYHAKNLIGIFKLEEELLSPELQKIQLDIFLNKLEKDIPFKFVWDPAFFQKPETKEILNKNLITSLKEKVYTAGKLLKSSLPLEEDFWASNTEIKEISVELLKEIILHSKPYGQNLASFNLVLTILRKIQPNVDYSKIEENTDNFLSLSDLINTKLSNCYCGESKENDETTKKSVVEVFDHLKLTIPQRKAIMTNSTVRFMFEEPNNTENILKLFKFGDFTEKEKIEILEKAIVNTRNYNDVLTRNEALAHLAKLIPSYTDWSPNAIKALKEIIEEQISNPYRKTGEEIQKITEAFNLKIRFVTPTENQKS